MKIPRPNRLGLLASILCTVTAWSQAYDTNYQDQIREYTTDERFYPSSIRSIVDHPTIPSPLKHFGTIVGAPGIMHRTTELYGYYQKLAEASDKIKIEQVGTSEEGRPIHLVTISSPETMQSLDTYKKILADLADPRKTSEEKAVQLAAAGKSVYYLNGGMHSTEMGSPEMLMELAYRLITDPSAETRHILENVIVLINPVSEPDGRDKQVDWYYRYSKSRTEWEDGYPRSTPYWGKYVFHDNNRDGLQITQAITKGIFKIYYDWHPNIMLDLHESVPLLYISTGTGPYNENVDPITVGEWQTIANHEMTSLAAQGLPGVFHWAFYDGWWPGYGVWVANTHNSIGRFYETFGNAGANTYLRDLTNSRYAGDAVTSREWYRPDPPTGKVFWSARNNTNYMQAGVLASLTYAADNRVSLLKNFYRKGVNNTQFAEKNKVKQFTIPANQRDPAMAAYLVNQLQAQGIEVYRVPSGENAGEYVIFLDQPYSKLAFDLLTEQKYPKEAKFPPYDAIAWTLGYLYGVDVVKEEEIKHDKSELVLCTPDARYIAKVTGSGPDYILPYKAQGSVLTGLYALRGTVRGAKFFVSDSSLVVGQDTLHPGSIVLKGLSKGQADSFSMDHGLDLVAHSAPESGLRQIQLPRVGVYHSWFDTQAEGWVRYTLEQKGIPYTSLDKDDLKAGKLNSKFDVLIIPHQRGDGSRLLHGVDSKFGPMPFTKTGEFPSHGYPDATDDMTGGPGFEGLRHLNEFVTQGGVLVPLENSAAQLADLGIGSALSRARTGSLFHPGSIVRVKGRQAGSPILYGYPEEFHLYKGNGALLETELYDRKYMVAQYGSDPLKDEQPYKGEIMGADPNADSPAPGSAAGNSTGRASGDAGEGEDGDAGNTANADGGTEEGSEAGEDAKPKTKPYVLSGMVRNEKEIIGHGAIFNVPQGKGRVVSFTFNPLNRYLNHHDSGLLWNVLLHWDHLE